MATTMRKHAAIMFTDIVGYTALMGSDEDRAFAELAKNREIHTKYLLQFHGKLIKEMGDGMLISFDLASDAVRCAIEIQKASIEENIALKIGIHEGEMMFEGNDVLGDGVNIAARIQDGAEEGCILISGSVYRDIKNKADIQTKFVAEKTFKNVDEKIRIYRVNCVEKIPNQKPIKSQPSIYKKRITVFAAIGFFAVVTITLLVWQLYPKKEINELEKSIAVRPFWNESSDPDNEYFVNGMCEDIRINLAKIAELRVLSRGSVEKYGDKKYSNADIAKDLEVSFVLEGTVQRIGNQLKIHVQLISGEIEDHIWQDTYEREIKDARDIFSIQYGIAETVAREIKAEISIDEKERIGKDPTSSYEAYNFFLRGKFYFDTHSDFHKASEFFNKAIEIDKNFALAYSYLAQCYQFIARYSLESPDSIYQKTKEIAIKAVELDSTLGESLVTLGLVKAIIDWDIYGAESYFIKALEYNPGNVEVFLSYAQYLRWLRRYSESISLAKKAIVIDPKNPMHYQWLAVFYIYTGEYNKSNQELENVLNLNPDFIHAHLCMSINYLELGDTLNAIKHLERSEDIKIQYSITESFLLTHINWQYSQIGIEKFARDFITISLDQSESQYVDPFYLAMLYNGLGEHEKAIEQLTEAVRTHSGQTIYLNAYSDWIFKNLAHDPRYQELLGQIGFKAN